MLGVPEATDFDLNFRVRGIPVRVHPLFWVGMVVLGWSVDVRQTAIFVACGFVSILVHELGHGLMGRLFGERPAIVLTMFGGICYSGKEYQTAWQRLLVLFAGPGAGFVLALMVVAIPFLAPGLLSKSEDLMDVLYVLKAITIFWSVLNLLPIWPLDGGQIAGVLLSLINRRDGTRWMHVVSLLIAGILAVVCLVVWHLQFMAIWFGLFAFANYQKLQQLHELARYGVYDEDGADWWKR